MVSFFSRPVKPLHDQISTLQWLFAERYRRIAREPEHPPSTYRPHHGEPYGQLYAFKVPRRSGAYTSERAVRIETQVNSSKIFSRRFGIEETMYAQHVYIAEEAL